MKFFQHFYYSDEGHSIVVKTVIMTISVQVLLEFGKLTTIKIILPASHHYQSLLRRCS